MNAILNTATGEYQEVENDADWTCKFKCPNCNIKFQTTEWFRFVHLGHASKNDVICDPGAICPQCRYLCQSEDEIYG